jgi:hypothetical protein
MRTSFTRLLPAIAKSGRLPAITRTPTRRTALAAAGFAAVCGGIAGPVAAAHGGTAAAVAPPEAKTAAAKTAPAAKAPDAKAPDAKAPAAKAPVTEAPAPMPVDAPAAKQLDYQYQGQTNFYYCGPAATRIALSAHGHAPSQDDVARQLGTTVNGTNSAVDTTRVLNTIDGSRNYHTTSIPGKFATPAQAERLQSDVVRAIGKGDAVVANIAGTATDTLGGMHSYDGGHYLTVVGYGDNGKTVLIADPADTISDGSYWMHTGDVANWMATRGYSS